MSKKKSVIFGVATLFILCVVVGLYLTYIGHRNDKGSDDREAIEQVVNYWSGREVITPLNIGYFTVDGRADNANYPSEKFKILRYVGKEGCSSCKLHLSRYPEILRALSDSAKCEVGFVCIVNPADMAEIRRILRRDNYAGLTMWIDEVDTINTINHFPEIEALQTFLLDKDNKVLAIGDPAVNPRVMRLYAQILTNDTINPARLPNTALSVEKEEIKLGKVAAGDTVHVSVAVKNIGQVDFILDKVVTSCDCTTAELIPERIAPGENAMLTIHFSEPEAVGDFFRTVNIFGNTGEVLIEINGTVI